MLAVLVPLMAPTHYSPATWPTQGGPINDVYTYHEIHLDSSLRDAGTNDDPRFILQPQIGNVLGVKLVSAQIPFTYYAIDVGTNHLYLLRDVDKGVNPNPVDVYLTPGNYTAKTLRSELETRLNAARVNTDNSFTVTFDESTGKFEVTSFGDQGEDVFALTAYLLDGPYATLGLRPGEPYTNLDGLFPNAAVPTGPGYILLTSNLGRVLNYVHVNGATNNSMPVLAKIPVTGDPGCMLTFQDPTVGFAFDYGSGDLQELVFGLRFPDGRPVRLNGASWSLCLYALTLRSATITRYKEERGTPLSTSSKRIRVG